MNAPTKSLPKPIRLIDQKDVICPAGEACGAGKAVRCRIEHSTIVAAENPSTVQGFCLGQYMLCPTWQAEKQRIEANRIAPLVSEWHGE